MKGVVAVLVVVSLIGLGIWLLFMQQPEPDEANLSISEDNPAELIEPTTGDELSQSEFAETSQVSATETNPVMTQEERAEQLAEAKAKLDVLILEYNENLSDPESRATTQAKINELLNEYNELALPAALAKLNEN